MKGKKPTYKQRKILAKNKLDTYKWLVQKDKTQEMQVIHIESQEVKIIPK